MTGKRIMILGAGGQIGQTFQHEKLPSDWELIALSRAACDITNGPMLRDILNKERPDLVINAAAMTAVDKCETEKDQARTQNFDGVATLAAHCSSIDAPLIHLSTDYVFDGRDENVPYREDAQMNPVSAYGETKMLGEEAIRQEMSWHVILRVSSVFSSYSNNLFTKHLKMIDERDELKVVTDQISCPTYAPDIAKAMIVMGDAILNGKSDGFGTFHYCGEGSVTRFDFVKAIMDVYAPYTTKTPRLLPVVSSDFPGLAERPPYSVLDCEKIGRVYGIHQKNWREGLKNAMQIILKQRDAETEIALEMMAAGLPNQVSSAS